MAAPLEARGLSFAADAGHLAVRLHDDDGTVVAMVVLTNRAALDADHLWAGAIERVKTASPSRGTH